MGCSLTTPVNATGNAVGSKVGESSTKQIIGFFFDGGDRSIKTAANNGGISKVSTVDYNRKTIFPGIAYKYTTIVTGE